MRTRTIVLIIAGVLGVVVLGCGLLIGGGVFALFQVGAPVREAGNTFMQALSDGEYADAYAMCAPALQRELGSAEALGSALENAGARPQSWNITSFNIENSAGRLEGTVETEGGTLPLAIELFNDDTWRITSFDFGSS